LGIFGAIHRGAIRAEWAAAEAGGLDLRVFDDGTFLLGAAPTHPSSMFNRALGFAEHPERTDIALRFFEEHGVEGEIVLDPGDVPAGVPPRTRLDVYLGDPTKVPPAPVDGLVIRVTDSREAATWMDLVIEGYAPADDVATVWRSMAAHSAMAPGRHMLLGERHGRLVAASSLFVTRAGGWLSWATVLPDARGLGIQQAMIAARAALAAELDCDVIAAWAFAGAHSSRNLERAGLPRIGERVSIRSADLA
jgi:GNAT superfamily N-acetyltransferase